MSTAIRSARARSGLSQRELAHRAQTSHPTLSAYETGRIDPSSRVATRIVEAAGFQLLIDLEPSPRTSSGRHPGEELLEILELAEHFPHRPRARLLDAPIFSRP